MNDNIAQIRKILKAHQLGTAKTYDYSELADRMILYFRQNYEARG